MRTLHSRPNQLYFLPNVFRRSQLILFKQVPVFHYQSVLFRLVLPVFVFTTLSPDSLLSPHHLARIDLHL